MADNWACGMLWHDIALSINCGGTCPVYFRAIGVPSKIGAAGAAVDCQVTIPIVSSMHPTDYVNSFPNWERLTCL